MRNCRGGAIKPFDEKIDGLTSLISFQKAVRVVADSNRVLGECRPGHEFISFADRTTIDLEFHPIAIGVPYRTLQPVAVHFSEAQRA